MIDMNVPDTSTYSFSNPDGTTFRIETTNQLGNTNVKVYINDIFSQESTYSELTGTITTNTYDADGHVTSCTDTALSSMLSIITSPPEYDINAIVPVDPIGGSYPNRSIHNEPVDNTGLTHTFYLNGKLYYYLGSGTDFFAPNVLARLHRTYTSTLTGQTRYFQWTTEMTMSLISLAVASFFGPEATVMALLDFTADGYLAYYNAVKIDTYIFDYTYQVTVDDVSYFTATRNITYWDIENITTNNAKWEQKTFNHGFSMGNQEMIRMGIEAYCAAN